VKVAKLSWRYLWVRPKRKEEIDFLERELNSYLGKSEIGLAAGLTVLLSAATLYFFVHTMSGVWGWINGLIFAICWGITLYPFVIVPFIWVVEASLAAAIVWFIDSIIVRPFSSLLEHPQLGQRVKILRGPRATTWTFQRRYAQVSGTRSGQVVMRGPLSVVLLAIGFHFDLLAS
jgi:hypothetical protein